MLGPLLNLISCFFIFFVVTFSFLSEQVSDPLPVNEEKLSVQKFEVYYRRVFVSFCFWINGKKIYQNLDTSSDNVNFWSPLWIIYLFFCYYNWFHLINTVRSPKLYLYNKKKQKKRCLHSLIRKKNIGSRGRVVTMTSLRINNNHVIIFEIFLGVTGFMHDSLYHYWIIA